MLLRIYSQEVLALFLKAGQDKEPLRNICLILLNKTFFNVVDPEMDL